MSGPYYPDRRELLTSSAVFGASAFGANVLSAQPKAAPDKPRKKYPFKKSINLWAFPYPQKMTLEQCLQLAKDAGFDSIELNYDLDSDLSPRSGPKEFAQIRKTAEKIGIAISGCARSCSGRIHSQAMTPRSVPSLIPPAPPVTLPILNKLRVLGRKKPGSPEGAHEGTGSCAIPRGQHVLTVEELR